MPRERWHWPTITTLLAESFGSTRLWAGEEKEVRFTKVPALITVPREQIISDKLSEVEALEVNHLNQNGLE